MFWLNIITRGLIRKYKILSISLQINIEPKIFAVISVTSHLSDAKNSFIAFPGYQFALAGILLIARSANAVIVREGFTPGLAEMVEPSQIYILS